ncbi:MAG: hypothetical protein ACPHP2_01750 [Limisphaerales bacterium]
MKSRDSGAASPLFGSVELSFASLNQLPNLAKRITLNDSVLHRMQFLPLTVAALGQAAGALSCRKKPHLFLTSTSTCR